MYERLLKHFIVMVASQPNKDWLELAKVVIAALGPIIAALIVGIAGAWIANHYAGERERIEREAVNHRHGKDLEVLRERHKLDKEAEWRSHAVELTKLEMQRKIEAWKANTDPAKLPLRPVILDFLAVYRDLIELDHTTPKDLYSTIQKTRIKNLKREVANDVSSQTATADSKELPPIATVTPEVAAVRDQTFQSQRVDDPSPTAKNEGSDDDDGYNDD